MQEPRRLSDLELQNCWVLWHDRKPPRSHGAASKTWTGTTLTQLGSEHLNTIGKFWAAFQMLPLPSVVAKGNALMLFREGVQPAWEDVHNAGGGRLTVALPAASCHVADAVWLDTLLAVVGAQLGDAVVGCVVDIRDGFDRVSVWLCSCPLQLAMETGLAWRRATKQSLPQTLQIAFQLHGSNRTLFSC